MQWNNGTLASVSNFPIAHYHTGTALTQLGTPTMVHKGFYFWTVSTTGLADGVYGVHIEANVSGFIAQGLGSFTVNNAIANEPTIDKSLAGNFSALSSTVASVDSAVKKLASALQAVQTAVGTMSAGVTALKASFQNMSNTLTTLSGLVDSATNSIAGINTFVLVVTVFAAITLVLALIVLVRRRD